MSMFNLKNKEQKEKSLIENHTIFLRFFIFFRLVIYETV